MTPDFWLTGILLFFVSFCYVGMKAAQNLAVVNFHFTYVLPVSLCLAFCEVIVVTILAVNRDILLFPFIGLGSGGGAMTTMYFYKRNKDNKEPK